MLFHRTTFFFSLDLVSLGVDYVLTNVFTSKYYSLAISVVLVTVEVWNKLLCECVEKRRERSKFVLPLITSIRS